MKSSFDQLFSEIMFFIYAYDIQINKSVSGVIVN